MMISFSLFNLELYDWCILNKSILNKTCITGFHRDKTRVQTPAKMFPHLKLLCWLFMGHTLGFTTEQRNSFLIKFGVFYNKNKIIAILFMVKYEKITLQWTVFCVVGAHNQQVFCMFKWGKKCAYSSPILMPVSHPQCLRLSPSAGMVQTHHLRIKSQAFYHCASAGWPYLRGHNRVYFF